MTENQATNEAIRAEKTVRATLTICGLPLRGSYTTNEVCKILAITEATFYRLAKAYSRDGKGKLVKPNCLETILLGSNRRTTYVELVSFFHRNNAWQRESTQKPLENHHAQRCTE